MPMSDADSGRRPRESLVIIYTCYGGTHSSPVAAAIHLGMLPRQTLPTREQLLALPLFDKALPADRGRLVAVGTDKLGNSVYVLGRGRARAEVMHNAIVSGLTLAGRGDQSVYVVDTLPCVNFSMRVGGFLSRGINFVRAGRPVVAYGTRRAYERLVRLVETVEGHIRAREDVSKFFDESRKSCLTYSPRR